LEKRMNHVSENTLKEIIELWQNEEASIKFFDDYLAQSNLVLLTKYYINKTMNEFQYTGMDDLSELFVSLFMGGFYLGHEVGIKDRVELEKFKQQFKLEE